MGPRSATWKREGREAMQSCISASAVSLPIRLARGQLPLPVSSLHLSHKFQGSSEHSFRVSDWTSQTWNDVTPILPLGGAALGLAFWKTEQDFNVTMKVLGRVKRQRVPLLGLWRTDGKRTDGFTLITWFRGKCMISLGPATLYWSVYLLDRLQFVLNAAARLIFFNTIF
jgi:hypothetical protein